MEEIESLHQLYRLQKKNSYLQLYTDLCDVQTILLRPYISATCVQLPPFLSIGILLLCLPLLTLLLCVSFLQNYCTF